MTTSITTFADLAATDQLLVVADFDGTLADLVPDPYAVPVNTDSLAALARLAGLPGTTVTILSGRHVDGLTQVCTLRTPVNLVGSHGAESASGSLPLTQDMRAHLAHIENSLTPILATHPKAELEVKPYQRVAHVAKVAEEDPEAARGILERVAEIDHGGAHITYGKNIVEFSAAEFTKGTWLAAERERVGATRTLFIGDDATDENGFRVLADHDLGVKVGEGATAASVRVADTSEVARVLTDLADARTARTGIPKETPARFRAVAAGFTAEVLRVHDWDAQTPCSEWTARDIVAHLATWYPANLRHAGVDLELGTDAREHPVEAWTELVSVTQALLDDPERSATKFTGGPDEGQTVEQATRGFFIPDVFMHTWDLGRSQGHDVRLDEGFAARNLAGMESLGGRLRESGQFGPPHPVPEDARTDVRLMAYLGRDPEFGLRD